MDDSETSFHELWARANKVSEKPEWITFWTPAGASTDFIVGTEDYPAYPDFYTNPSSTIPFHGSTKYKDIKKYFHNKTAVCTSFDVDKFGSYDEIYKYDRQDPYGPCIQGKLYHQHYQTEHVFEGQTIGRSFRDWLPKQGYSHAWSEGWIFKEYKKWEDPVTKHSNAFIHILLDEMGSKLHYDRLTVFLTNCNCMKGNLFGGATSTSDSRFRALEAGAEQLLNAREVGMIFGYMSLDTIWDAYCDVYNGMLDLFEAFDPWYKQQSQKASDLAGLWPKFIREELDMIVKRGRDDMKRMKNMRETGSQLRCSLGYHHERTQCGDA